MMPAEIGLRMDTTKIMTAEDILSRRRRPLNNFPVFYKFFTKKQFNPALIYAGQVLTPRVNHSRWIIDCPFCSGAELYWESANLHYCVSCANNMTELPILVKMPGNRLKIEEILLKRENIENRNWIGETIADLQRENKDRGVK